MYKILSTIFILLGLFTSALGQATGVVKGVIVDADSDMPLIGCAVELLISNGERLATISDLDGYYRIVNVPIGRHLIAASYLGYETITLPNIEVGSGKDVNQDIKLEESLVQLEEVVITAVAQKGESINELAAISSTTFSLEEVTRYSGGRNDVSKLVSAYAGVSNSNDSRNDIVIRGNSPTGVLWRLEGIAIPNPNHFSTLGTTGGPVSALNTNLLKDSDFLTSAFPAEYGNALSGVFDVGFRSGNKDRFEFTAQLAAFSGFEFMAEGPLNASKSGSFLVSYRHAFTSVAGSLGLDIGTNAVPNYRDLTFKLDFGKSKLGRFSLFGIGGTSDIQFLGAETDANDLFAEQDSDSKADSKIGIVGVKHNVIVNSQTYIKTVLSVSQAANIFSQIRYKDAELADGYENVNIDDKTNRLVLSSFVNKKHNARNTTRAGFVIERLSLVSDARDRTGADLDGDGLPDWTTLRDLDDALHIIQPFIHHKLKLTDRLTINAGLHMQYVDQNKETALEPRLAINYDVHEKSSLNIGYGLHSQLQPLPVLFYLSPTVDGQFLALNENLGFTKAHHLVLGYTYRPAKDWSTKMEIYYQSLYNVPVEKVASSFSVLNAGADFVFPTVGDLANDGSGRNYGAELTIEKYFSNGYYGLLTGSLFQSKYTPSDGVERNSAFNNEYVYNVLAGKEWSIGRNKKVSLDMKFTNAGGRYYTPIDLAASQMQGSEVLDESKAFEERYPAYLRLDIKIGIRIFSNKRFSQQFFLDFQNVTNRDNVFVNRYNRLANAVNTVYQIGFFPDVLYRVRF